MMTRWMGGIAVLLGCALSVAPAAAKECAPLKMLASNYFLPDHCLGRVIFWPHGDVAFTFQEGYFYAAAEVPSSPANAIPSKPAPAVFAALREAQNALKRKDLPVALDFVSKAKAVPDLQPFDLYLIHRFAMAVQISLKDLSAAAVEAEAAADSDPDVIPDADKAAAYKAALQLSLNEKHFDKAVGYARLYQETNPPVSDQALIGAALYHARNDPRSEPREEESGSRSLHP